MARKAVAGERAIKFRHQIVTIDLSDDRGCSDRKVDPIAFVKAVLGLGKIRNRPAIDQHMLWENGQQRHRELHCADPCPVNINSVNIIDGNYAYTDSGGLRPNTPIEPLP